MAVQDEIPKSRITINYETEVNGQKKAKEIPLRLMVMGDLSKGKSKDSQKEISDREVRELDGKNLDATIKDMGIKVSMELENHIDSEGKPLSVELPIDSMKSFNPSMIAENIPELKSLINLKEMLNDLGSALDNNKSFRAKLGEIISDSTKLEEVRKMIPNLESFKFSSNNEAASTPVE